MPSYESTLGNLLEGLRFVGDHYGLRAHPDGVSMVAHLTEVVNILWHVGQVRDQFVLLSGLLFRMPADGVCGVSALQPVFGERIAGYVSQAHDLAALQPRPMQRLRPAKEEERLKAARQIRLAEGIVCLRRRPDHYQLPAELASLRSSLPEMDAYLRQLKK